MECGRCADGFASCQVCTRSMCLEHTPEKYVLVNKLVCCDNENCRDGAAREMTTKKYTQKCWCGQPGTFCFKCGRIACGQHSDWQPAVGRRGSEFTFEPCSKWCSISLQKFFDQN